MHNPRIPDELDIETLAYRASGQWSAYGMELTLNHRSIAMYNNRAFYLDRLQPWVYCECVFMGESE